MTGALSRLMRRKPSLSPSRNKISSLLRLTDGKGHPNHTSPLWRATKDIEGIKLNLKFFGYELARLMAAELPERKLDSPPLVDLASKPSTQADLESDWAAYWCGELGIPVVFHRKVWELTYALHALWRGGAIVPGARGIGFGCGEEPLPSYLAAKGVKVTITDLPPNDRRAAGWADTNQLAGPESAFKAHLVDRVTFDANTELRHVDMNAIRPELSGYDFCWSICALEHLGSIRRGLDFIENSLKVLRPGGLAVHTTEFNFLNDDETIDDWVTVLFQRKHFREIHDRLTSAGHHLAPLDFDVGSMALDKFIDLPPYVLEIPESVRGWTDGSNHIKLMVDGFACTCFGLIIRKAP
jgi:hypothetical protein